MRPIIILFIGVLVYWCIGIFSPTHAETLQSNSYTIRQGNFNMTSGLKSSASYSLTDTVGQTAAEYFSSTGYHVKAGFQYMYTLYDFSFSLSSLSVALGDLIPNSFKTASHTITVSTPAQGYSVTAHETSKLTKSGSSDTIPDTICDSGPCTETSAEIWTTPTNNGFGYNVTGDDHDPEFATSSYFRPFPDYSLGESSATIMATTNSGLVVSSHKNPLPNIKRT
ncbi:MAG: hypothetical protein UX62_C0061G0005 [Microgenomates group bacterium GW2011_GWA2_46_7]|nr:MAG: hypothetical protein UX62_C0061G0005 [Microgenomates group bacterium GW2011_GWA2_46_7]